MQPVKPALAAVRAVTFDAAGTLIAPHPGVGAVYAEVLANFGITANPEALEAAFRKAFKGWKSDCPGALLDQSAWRDIVRRTLHDHVPTNAFDEVFEALWTTFAEGRRWRVLPSVWETLQKLSAARLRLAVLSNNDARLHTVLSELGLARYFEKVFVSVEVGAEKPDPVAFRAVEQALALPSEALLHVGDSQREDAAGARASGWQAVLLGEAENLPEGAFAIATLPEVCDLLCPHR